MAASAMLRDYQEEALSAVGDAFARDCWSQVIVLPTGGGKTVVFAHLTQQPMIRMWLDTFHERQQKVLVLAHREELLDQAADKIQHYNPDLRIGIEQGNRHFTPMDDVVIASIPTLVAQDCRRLREFNPKDFRIVVVDEAHHAPAETYQMVLSYFDLLPVDFEPGTDKIDNAEAVTAAREQMSNWWKDHYPNRLLLGVTATPNRGDAIGLEWTFNELVYERTIRWMVQHGYLCPPVGYLVETNIDLDQVKTVAGDFNVGQLAKAVNTPERNEAAVAGWQEYCADRSTIAFCADVQHAKDLHAAFRARDISACWVSGDGAGAGDVELTRDEAIDGYKNGTYTVITNCNILTEGFDHPGVSAILHCRPTKSQGLYMQMTGRGLRLADGKTDCVVLDVVDIARKHSLVSAGDLFGLPRLFNARGKTLTDLADRIDELKALYPDMPMLSGLDLDTLEASVKKIDLWAVADSEVVTKFARLKWFEASAERYHISIPQRQPEDGALVSGEKQVAERIEITQGMLGGWTIQLVAGKQATQIGAADDIGTAFARAERWIQNLRPHAFSMKAKDAKWRQERASKKQIELLTRMKAPFDPATLTRGQASDMLDKFFERKSRATKMIGCARC
jgi:ATP-dependent helicase IRC3